eukprot:g55126.t1
MPAWHATAPAGLRLDAIVQWGELRFHETSGYHLYAAPGLAYVPPLALLADAGLVQSWDYSFAHLTSELGCDTSYGLNVSGAESVVGLFEGSTGVARPHGASRWDTHRLRNASRAFAGLPALATLDLSRWDTARLEDVTEMFDGGAALTRTGVGAWTGLPSLQRFAGLFRGLGRDFREPLTAWTTPALALARWTARGWRRTYTVTADPGGRYPVRGWALTPAWHATASAGLRLDAIVQWGELRFHETSGYHLYAAPGLTYVPSLAWLPEAGLVRSWDHSFAGLTAPVPELSYGLNVSGAESAVGMFEGSTGLRGLYGTQSWDTRRLRNASRAFAGLPALTELDLSRWDTSALEDVSEMFESCSALTRTGVGSWTSLPRLSHFEGLFWGVLPDSRELEALANWSTPALAPGSADCSRLAPYTVLSQARWPAACSRSHFLALVRAYGGGTTTLTLAPTAGPGVGGTDCDYWLRLSGRVDGLWYVEGAFVVDVVAWGDVQLYHPVGSTTALFKSWQGGYPLRYLAPTAGSRALRGVAPEHLLQGMSEFVGDARDWDWSWLTPATHPRGFTYMIQGCTKFNQDLDDWNTSGVASLDYMFWQATAFDGSIGTWDTSQVTSLEGTFQEAYAFDRPIGGWDVGKAGRGRLAPGAHQARLVERGPVASAAPVVLARGGSPGPAALLLRALSSAADAVVAVDALRLAPARPRAPGRRA